MRIWELLIVIFIVALSLFGLYVVFRGILSEIFPAGFDKYYFNRDFWRRYSIRNDEGGYVKMSTFKRDLKTLIFFGCYKHYSFWKVYDEAQAIYDTLKEVDFNDYKACFGTDEGYDEYKKSWERLGIESLLAKIERASQDSIEEHNKKRAKELIRYKREIEKHYRRNK